MVVKITGLGRAGLFQKITLGFFALRNIFLFIEIYYYYYLFVTYVCNDVYQFLC